MKNRKEYTFFLVEIILVNFGWRTVLMVSVNNKVCRYQSISAQTSPTHHTKVQNKHMNCLPVIIAPLLKITV